MLRTARVAQDSNRHVKRLIALRDWVRPLGLAPDASACTCSNTAIPRSRCSTTRNNGVDHLIMGARGITGVRAR